MSSWLKTTADAHIIAITVAPRASRTRVMGEYNGTLKVSVTSAPVEGEANRALIEFLSRLLKVPKSQVEVISGETSKKKLVRVPLSAKIELLQ